MGDEVRFAGTDYGPFEFFPGPLDDQGDPPTDCTPYDRIYSVTRADLDAFEAGEPHTADIEEWPWELGAPVADGDGNPDNYNLGGGDRPAVYGHQTAWWVMNDAAGPHGWSDSAPLGLEVQVTAFAAAATNAIHNTTFYRYKLIYKGQDPLTDAYFGIMSDTDLGNAGDDFVGSDTTLEMGFVYNGDDFDEGSRGYGSAPPALGYTFLMGAERASEQDASLGMSKFVTIFGGSSPQGHPSTRSDAYNYLRGVWRDGTRITHGGTGYGGDVVADFMFPGDPVTKSFWSEENTDDNGSRNTPSDRHFVASSGPFNMEMEDTQEIVIAVVWSRGDDNYDSVDRLRQDVAIVRDEFHSGRLDNYPIPPSFPLPELGLSHNELEVVLAAAEKDTRTLTMTNSGTADLSWEVASTGPKATFKFLAVANAAGPLDPPDQAAFSFNSSGFPTPDGMPPYCADDTVIDYALCNDRPSTQQQVGPGRWGIAAGGTQTGKYSEYLDRSILGRGRDLTSLGGYDYEWRFVGTSVAVRAFEDGESVEVPFQLWRTGRDTPDDPRDDVRMIPWICEEACGGGAEPMVFDIGGDHPASGGNNDPYTDLIYWNMPPDESPGDAGYQAYVDAVEAGTYDYPLNEILARQVIVGFNLGDAPPYAQELPEPGTIFRIETAVHWLRIDSDPFGTVDAGNSEHIPLTFDAALLRPGSYQDEIAITTPLRDVVIPVTLEVVEATTGTKPAAPLALVEHTLSQNYPNPFIGSTEIRFGMPHAAHARVVLFDILGRQVRVLFDDHVAAGWHTVTLQNTSLPAGSYFYRLKTGSVTRTMKMMVLK